MTDTNNVDTSKPTDQPAEPFYKRTFFRSAVVFLVGLFIMGLFSEHSTLKDARIICLSNGGRESLCDCMVEKIDQKYSAWHYAPLLRFMYDVDRADIDKDVAVCYGG
jgi:hypothetical protein